MSNDIIRMAREAGSIDSEEVIETVWRAFSAAEREACAKVCDVAHARHIAEYGDYIGETYAAECARTIRARSKE